MASPIAPSLVSEAPLAHLEWRPPGGGSAPIAVLLHGVGGGRWGWGHTGPALAAQGWRVLEGDLPLPLPVLKEEVLAHNGDWMRRFLALTGARLAPHGKTTMSPQLFHRQIADGAWAITTDNTREVRSWLAEAGGSR